MSRSDIIMESREWKWKMVKTAIEFMREIIEITSLTSKWQRREVPILYSGKKRAKVMTRIPLTLRQS